MKRILAIVLILAMISVPVLADDVDYSSMSTDELIAMRSAITEEIDKRTADGSGIIGSGSYVVGKDIKAGTYLISDVKTDGSTFFSVFVYENEEKLKKNEDIGDHNDSCYLREGGTATVNLHDGYIMLIDGSGVMQESRPSWAVE